MTQTQTQTQTQNYEVHIARGFGHLVIIRKADNASVLLQGQEADEFEAELENIWESNEYFNTHCSMYDQVMECDENAELVRKSRFYREF